MLFRLVVNLLLLIRNLFVCGRRIGGLTHRDCSGGLGQGFCTLIEREHMALGVKNFAVRHCETKRLEDVIGQLFDRDGFCFRLVPEGIGVVPLLVLDYLAGLIRFDGPFFCRLSLFQDIFNGLICYYRGIRGILDTGVNLHITSGTIHGFGFLGDGNRPLGGGGFGALVLYGDCNGSAAGVGVGIGAIFVFRQLVGVNAQNNGQLGICQGPVFFRCGFKLDGVGLVAVCVLSLGDYSIFVLIFDAFLKLTPVVAVLAVFGFGL